MTVFIKILLLSWVVLCCLNFANTTASAEPLKLNDGANSYESKAISFALADMIASDLKHYLGESHFVHGPKCANKQPDCRQNLSFELDFQVASVDLDYNGDNEVIVNYIGPNVCGSGGCTAYILLQDVGGWLVIGEFFPGERIELANTTSNGFRDIHFYGKSGSKYQCFYDGKIYKC